MTSHEFQFRSTWRLQSDLVTIWNHIAQVSRYPSWWPSVAEVTLVVGPELPVRKGLKAAYAVRSPLYILRYETEVVEVTTGKSVLATATGDLTGYGRWTFDVQGDTVLAIFDWHVNLNRPLLQSMSRLPFARMVMSFFHQRVMRQGEAGLRQLLAEAAVPIPPVPALKSI